MKIFKLLFRFILACSLIVLISCQETRSSSQSLIENKHFSAGEFPDRIMQNIAKNPSSQIALSWRTSTDVETGYVEITSSFGNTYYPDEVSSIQAEPKRIRFDNVEDNYFQVVIDYLEPATKYMVRVGNSGFRSEWFSVKTAPQQFEPFNFIWFGDVQNDVLEFAPRIFRQAIKTAPDASLIVHSGDLVLSSGNDETWGEWFYAGGWLFQQIPSLAVAGNSDHFRVQEEPVDQRMLFPQWHGVFHFPKNGSDGLDNMVFVYDHPGVRFVGLYTNFESTTKDDREIYIYPENKLSNELFVKQTEWLENMLSTNEQPWLIVVMHHPIFTAREDRDNELLLENWLPLFEKYEVDMVLQGHDHVYARGLNADSVNGSSLPVYVTSFAGGKSRKVDFSHDWITVAKEHIQMFQVVEVEESKINFKAFDALGNLMDYFVIEKSGAGKILID